MPKKRSQDGEVAKHASGIFDGLAANAVGAALTPLAVHLWFHFRHTETPEWAKGVLPNLLAAALLPAMFRIPALYLRFLNRHDHDTAKARGDRISIYVAEFGDDEESHSARESVFQSIQKELGKYVELIPAGVRFELTKGVSLDDAVINPTREARELLQKKGGDLLIWGRLHPLDGKTQLELRFVSSAQEQDGTERKVFGFGDKLTLDANFGPEMGTALAAIIASLASPVTSDSGRYLVHILRPIADRLRGLITHLPVSMKSGDRGKLLVSYGLIEVGIGEQSGQPAPLEQAIAVFRRALEEYTRERAPRDWAMTQNYLGTALAILGERENGTDRLQQAVVAYREALEERTRERMPLNWATTQSNLGVALKILGERENGTDHLEQAVAAQREALEERTQERAPIDWAMTQHNLGVALHTLGERENRADRLEQAIAAYREALKEYTREKMPLNWAGTQNNLGAAFATLGEWGKNSDRLRQAVAAYREALKERTRERVPLDWAATQNNFGNVLTTLGALENSKDQLEQAVAAFRQALKEYNRERVPLDWAMTQNNLGNALKALGERENSTERLTQAVASYHEALKEYTPTAASYYHSITQHSLAQTERILTERLAQREGSSSAPSLPTPDTPLADPPTAIDDQSSPH